MTSEHQCFCELAPLYVLELLSDTEREWVDQQLVEYPELAEELVQYQTAATAIPYSVPVVPMAADLKERLFERLELEPVNVPSLSRNFNDIISPILAVRSHDIRWEPHFVPGVEIAIFHTDLINREIIGLFRAEPGMCYPTHSHAGIEDMYMLNGDLVIGDEIYGAGDYIRSQPGSSHAPYTTNGCMFFFRTSLDDEYLDLASTQS